MKIIISPTKTMKRKNYTNKKSQPLFLDKSLKLRSILEDYDKIKIKNNFKVSNNLTNKIYDFYQNPKNCVAAINLYEGLSFKNIELDTFNDKDFDFLEKHLYIMSAIYGALRPYDQITEYRLDYIMKFEKNLYDYWAETLKNLLKDEDVIINLASNEFLKSISHPNIINIHLLDEKGRALSTQAKMGRGNMIAYIAKNKITDIEQLKQYNNLDYKFDDRRSDNNNFYFTKEK